ncbi:winged helix-turn-helix domain-containing protein [Microlunatus speluncae]|uniref:winged helix-turn-helix domain-containing protein n=1 Tax=Microlunatus speluncae TaxID=2594267 RepID=UPI0012663CEE|nr:winged helix-turn-helix domain-containing protein [Microlunatus speluncae]
MDTYTELRLGDLGRLSPRVAVEPSASLISVVADLLGGPAQGIPAHCRAKLLPAELATDRARAAQLFGSPLVAIPDCLSPMPYPGEPSGRSFLDRTADVDRHTLLAELEADLAGEPVPEALRPVIDRPGTFLAGFSRVAAHAWEFVEAVWRRRRRRLSREVVRIGTAAVTGTLGAGLSLLGPRIRLVGSSLLLPDPRGEVIDLAGRTLVLVPLISGGTASLLNVDQDDHVWIGYPLRECGTTHPAESPADLILGEARTQILRGADGYLTMSEVAALIGSTGGSATYHCKQLESAGLISRHRVGGSVRVHRTLRGEEILDLLH